MNKVEKTVQSILDNHQKENYQDIILSLVNNSKIEQKINLKNKTKLIFCRKFTDIV